MLLFSVVAFQTMEIDEYAAEKSDLEENLSEMTNERNSLLFEVSSLDENLTYYCQYYDWYMNESGIYKLHDPTFYEAIKFMREDQTEDLEYQEIIFECDEYAEMVNNNAEQAGIRCCYVTLEFDDSAHSIIGFNTTDQGMVYFEPQSDERVKYLYVNQDYWTDCVIPEPGYYYEEDPDDTIRSINRIW